MLKLPKSKMKKTTEKQNKNLTNDLKEKMSNRTHKRCQQTMCGYHVQGGCKKCESCNAPPHILKKTCSACITCATVPGNLRWGDNKQLADQQEAIRQMTEQIIQESTQDAVKGRMIIIQEKR